jgi:hypothetical protein
MWIEMQLLLLLQQEIQGLLLWISTVLLLT